MLLFPLVLASALETVAAAQGPNATIYGLRFGALIGGAEEDVHIALCMSYYCGFLGIV